MPDPAALPAFIANHLGLDFVNTRFGTSADPHEHLATDADVLAWLEAAGVLPDGHRNAPEGIAVRARALRDEARAVLAATRAGRPADMVALNAVLHAGQPRRGLTWDATRARPTVVTHPRDVDSDTLLYPVADAIAQLLTEADLRQVRTCEAHDCTLLFQDTTKSHRRRWCSMAVCGNRMKAAAFRSRKNAG